MKTKLALVILASSLHFGCSSQSTPPEALARPGLDSWVESLRQPGFTLLDEDELPNYYVCAFEMPRSEVAFLYHWIGSEEPPETHSLTIRDASGRNLQDETRWNQASELPRGENGEFYQGMVIPIEPSYRGPLHLDFRATRGPGPDSESVYQKPVTRPRDR